MTRRSGSSHALLNRRRLIASGAAAALLAASRGSASAGPQRGGMLRIAVPGVPDPRTLGVSGRLLAPGSVFDCLTEVTADGQLRGELAEDWVSEDGAGVWIVTLARDAVFHDGQPFGADDAIASLKRPHGVDTGIARLKKLRPWQIQVTLEAPDPGFPFLLSDPRLVMLPGGDGATALRQGNGTGLYRYAGSPTVDALRLERVASHRKDGSAGWFDRVELLRVSSPTEAVNALVSGRVDAASAIPPADPRLAQGRFQIVAPQSDRQLRLIGQGPHGRAVADALKVGLDRRRVLDGVLGGYGRLAGDHPLQTDAVVAPDPERARAILRSARVDRIGISGGAGVHDLPALPALLSVLRAFANQVGVDLAPARGSADLIVELADPMPTEDLALRAFPSAGLSDPKGFARQLAQARLIPNYLQRREIYANLAQILAAKSLVSVPVFAHSAFAHTSRLTHLGHIGAFDTLDSARMAERWFYRFSGQLPS